MPVDILPLVEIDERKRELTDQALAMEAGPEREQVLAEIELLRKLADLKQQLETKRKVAPREVPCSPPRGPASRRATRGSG